MNSRIAPSRQNAVPNEIVKGIVAQVKMHSANSQKFVGYKTQITFKFFRKNEWTFSSHHMIVIQIQLHLLLKVQVI